MIAKHLKAALGAAAFTLSMTLIAPASLAQADMKGMMKHNNDKMASMQMSGKPDIDFAMMMRIHHQGAIQMAEMELKNGKEPQMRRMAQNIISAQKKEIAELDKFLAEHGQGAHKK